MTADFLIVGAGVIGVSVARGVRRRYRGKVLVIDKEPCPAQHASGRNSGVLHAGVYYGANSLKARFCVEGNRRMREYCTSKKIPINCSGKVIVATRPDELSVLEELHRRGTANGVRLAWLDMQALLEVEPCARTVEKALYVRDTAVVDPLAVMDSLVSDAVKEGVEFSFDCAWQGLDDIRRRVFPGQLARGVDADQVAHAFGVGKHYRVLPFRGGYRQLNPRSRLQVRGNIYPVPDLRNPFLGVHFTRRPDGQVTMGPTALPLAGREQYAWLRGVNLDDGLGIVRYLIRLFKNNSDHFRSTALREVVKLTRTGFYREASRLVQGLEKGDLLPGKRPGIRAQLIDTNTAELIQDFLLGSGQRSTHVLNAVSPAFTCAMPFAEYVVDSIKLGD